MCVCVCVCVGTHGTVQPQAPGNTDDERATLYSWVAVEELQLRYRNMGDCQDYGPFLGPYYNTGPNTGPNLGDPNRDQNFDNLPYRHVVSDEGSFF